MSDGPKNFEYYMRKADEALQAASDKARSGYNESAASFLKAAELYTEQARLMKGPTYR
jgi:hypothetical protein